MSPFQRKGNILEKRIGGKKAVKKDTMNIFLVNELETFTFFILKVAHIFPKECFLKSIELRGHAPHCHSRRTRTPHRPCELL